ncbi:DUF4832 domain-containing protein [Novipirellula rosea]|uniref:DUF4832 domain-containing protein n=1 Tax=Novipirellula rosea TaxID=1031540 RepID=A0ABP8M981_9BACT
MKLSISLLCLYLGIAISWLPMGHVAADDIVIRPPIMDGPLDNPLKGWCPYTDAGKIHQPYSMVFQYVSWRELEPVQGDFQFDEWEKTWDVQAAKGKHILFRVYVDYPSLPSGLPDWLRTAGVKETIYDDHGGGRSPDYDDPRMIAGMERLIAALGKRYNQHPRIAFVQLGLLGFWGEWHTWPREKLYASPDTERRIVDAYNKAFPDKSLMVRYAKGYAGQQKWIGFHDDMFPQDTDNGKDWSFLAGLRTANRSDNWQVAVVGGEMVPNKANQWLGKDFGTTLTMANRSHFTWVGPYCPALEKSKDETFLKRSQELVRKMGYEFQITEFAHPVQVKAKQSVQFILKGKNLGVAPFYYPWSVQWALLDASGKVVTLQQTHWDIRRWKPGSFSEDIKLAFEVPAGTYRVGLGIRDPWQDRPAIRFANDLPVVAGWTILSELTVVP